MLVEGAAEDNEELFEKFMDDPESITEEELVAEIRKATLSKSLGKEHRGVAAYLNGKIDDFHDQIDSISDNLSVLPVYCTDLHNLPM